jgi:glycosyltransferase involved in cell wall biosynthesis
MSTLAKANKHMREGDFAGAAEIYKELLAASEPIAAIARANLSVLSRRDKNISTSVAMLSNKERAVSNKIASKMYIKDLYEEIRCEIARNGVSKIYKEPLVSIIVTAHNTEEYIEACLESLINQTYQNKEIIIVDDLSTDSTPEIIQRIAKSNRRIQSRRLNSNLGTYFAKNLGIRESRGEILFFQDSDDTSHPQRIELLTSQLLAHNKLVVRGSYSRVDPDTDEVLCVNNLYKKLGLITLGVRREVFGQMGFFNCTTKASDDEFYNRFVKFFGKAQITNNEMPLYYNTYRDNSLFADMVSRNADGSIEQKPSKSRAQYVENFRKIHDSSDIESIRRRFRFPKIRDGVTVDADMTKLANPRSPVIVNVCSIPQREHAFQRTINSIIDQCDQINVYLDGYPKTPSFLEKYKDKCTVTQSSQAPGLRDNGKFLALGDYIKERKHAYYLTIDDDILYPVDYVNALIKQLDRFNKKCVVGVHGVILKNQPNGYFADRRIVYHFVRSLEYPRCVNILGTGTLAFHTSIFSDFDLSSFEESGMADIYFSIFCKNGRIPQVAIARHDGWLVDMNPTPEDTLFNEFKNDDSKQARLIVKNFPWGLQSIGDINRSKSDQEDLKKELMRATIKLQSLTSSY